MNKKVTALALSMWIFCGSVFMPLASAEMRGNYDLNSMVPTLLKTSISQHANHVELTLGKAQVIRLSMPAKRVSISDPEVVGIVLLSPTEIQLIGKSVGVANLLVWSEQSGENYLNVDLSVHRDVSTLANKIKMIDEGISIVPVAAEDAVILTGVAESLEMAQLAYDLARAFFSEDGGGATFGGGEEASSNSPGSGTFAQTSTKIINLIRVVGQPTTKAELIQERLRDIDSNITLKVVPGFGGKEKAILMGTVRNASSVSKAVNLASVFYGTPGIKVLTGPGGNAVKEGKEQDSSGGFEAGTGGGLIGNLAGNILHGSIITDLSGNVVSMLEVEERPQIKCTIKFLEVSKAAGINYDTTTFLNDTETVRASTYGRGVGQGSVDGVFGQVGGRNAAQVAIRTGTALSSMLSGLITDGKARVLAEPTITSISGEPASFLAGGEFPIPVIGTNGGVSVLFKQFGIRLDLLATVTDRGTIHMQVSPEVSSLDPNGGITIGGTTVPGLRTRRGQTVVEMRNGDNFILGGLYNHDMTDNFFRTPFFGQLPILGALFRSREFQRRETEILIVIHPEIQSQMNLSYTKPVEQKQVAQFQPEELMEQLKQNQKKQLESSKPQPEVSWEDTSKTIPSADSYKQPAVVVEESAENKKRLKQIEKAQRKMEKLSRQIENGKAASDKQQATVLKSEDKPAITVAGAAAEMELPLDPNYLKQQQETLSALLEGLERKEPPAAEMVKPVEKSSQPLEIEKQDPKKTIELSEKPLEDKNNQTSHDKKQDKMPETTVSEDKPVASTKKVETLKTQGTDSSKSTQGSVKPVSKTSQKSPVMQGQHFIDQNVKHIQKQLSQFLGQISLLKN